MVLDVRIVLPLGKNWLGEAKGAFCGTGNIPSHELVVVTWVYFY
jgi:hypothetical protein